MSFLVPINQAISDNISYIIYASIFHYELFTSWADFLRTLLEYCFFSYSHCVLSTYNFHHQHRGSLKDQFHICWIRENVKRNLLTNESNVYSQSVYAAANKCWVAGALETCRVVISTKDYLGCEFSQHQIINDDIGWYITHWKNICYHLKMFQCRFAFLITFHTNNYENIFCNLGVYLLFTNTYINCCSPNFLGKKYLFPSSRLYLLIVAANHLHFVFFGYFNNIHKDKCF